MPARKDIKKILLIGSGPIKIGQGCEFDYSATQACKALMNEGYEVVLANSNPATIMTDPSVSTATYIEPLTKEYLKEIIIKEKPEAILPTMGGQTALNLAIDLDAEGFFQAQGVEMIGARAPSIMMAEDRQLFAKAMEEIHLKTSPSVVIHSLDAAKEALPSIGLPTIIRPAFTLGGEGGGIARDEEDFIRIVNNGLTLSPISQVQLDKSLLGWKEFELEVIRDLDDNCIIICSIENIDPMGVHTGDSITVAPAQTLTDREYQKMRTDAIKVIRKIGVETGGANVQFAVNPKTGEQIVVEMNPRVSRSSALASKATGFPIAKVAALLAVGYRLHELQNDIVGGAIPASFEPTLDYVVTKIPRFDFEKFSGTKDQLSTQMHSVGEVMAIGRNFNESFQKALNSLENTWTGFEIPADYNPSLSVDEILLKVAETTSTRIHWIGQAFRRGLSIEEVNSACAVDPWFLGHMKDIIDLELQLASSQLSDYSAQQLREIKYQGFSDLKLANLSGVSEKAIRNHRHQLGVTPSYRRVDSCAGEFSTPTSYLYSTYDSDYCESNPTDNAKKIAVLGSGPNRIGQGIEFDYSCVHVSLALRAQGYESVMINCNPETVSTDFDISDKLYLEPISEESVLEILSKEGIKTAATQFGGQTPLKLAQVFQQEGIDTLGTTSQAIEICEDRFHFRALCQKLSILQPRNQTITWDQLQDGSSLAVAEELGFPLVIRPSFVLGGRGMEILYSKDDLAAYPKRHVNIFNEHPILLDQYLGHCIEVDVEAICDGSNVTIAAILEHVEEAGVHSGDSACSLPAWTLSEEIKQTLRDYTTQLAQNLKVVGLINVQFAINPEGTIYILEVNPRASRTVPFVSKVVGHSLPEIATKAALGISLPEMGLGKVLAPLFPALKEAVFPFDKMKDTDPFLGPEMKSTGEAMSFGSNLAEAYFKVQQAAGLTIPEAPGGAFISVRKSDRSFLGDIAEKLDELGFNLYATEGTASIIKANNPNINVELVSKLTQSNASIPNGRQLLESGKISLVINTTEGVQSIKDSSYIRQTALKRRIYTTTTISGAFRICTALQQHKNFPITQVSSLQEQHMKQEYLKP